MVRLLVSPVLIVLLEGSRGLGFGGLEFGAFLIQGANALLVSSTTSNSNDNNSNNKNNNDSNNNNNNSPRYPSE